MNIKKYFLAVVIPEPIATKIDELKQGLLLEQGLKGALRTPPHITLHMPFVWNQTKETELINAFNTIKQESVFKIEFNNFSFFEPRVIYIDVLPNQELVKLHQKIKHLAKTKLNLFNEVDNLRGFYPHVTVANRDLKKTKFYELKPTFEKQQFIGSFNYSGFCLLRLEYKWEVINDFYTH